MVIHEWQRIELGGLVETNPKKLWLIFSLANQNMLGAFGMIIFYLIMI